MHKLKLFIEPSSDAYYKNIYFDETNKYYNRDNCLGPNIFLKKKLDSLGIEVNTADYLLEQENENKIDSIYISFGNRKNVELVDGMNGTLLSAFFVFEPPVVAPELYRAIPYLAKKFKRVYVHTTEGELGKYIHGAKNVYKFYWPQSYNGVLEDHWGKTGRKHMILINANKKPRLNDNELYGKRIEALAYFAKYGEIDLYGFGWDKFNWYMPYIKYRKEILKSYRGKVDSKYAALAEYKFCLCYENMFLSSYFTEKIFDCFLTGTIPIYLGARDVEKYVYPESFIDMRKYKNYDELRSYINSLTDKDVERYRQAGREYMNSELYKPFSKEHFAELIYNIVKEDTGEEGK